MLQMVIGDKPSSHTVLGAQWSHCGPLGGIPGSYVLFSGEHRKE
jgi:hypothetical protein